jgi:restriction system protein
MARRQSERGFFDDLYDILLVVPAWVGPPLALVFFLVLRFVVPGILGGSGKPDVGAVIAAVARGSAAPAGGLVLLLWLAAEFEKWRKRRLLDSQSGLNSIRDLSWQEFEHLVGEAYRRQGYVVQETGSTGGDGGIDLSLAKGGERVLVQCKQWRTRRVGVKPVRELYGVMTAESAARGVLVTWGSFTREARAFAEGKPLALMEGPELWDLVRSVRATPKAQRPPGTAPTEASPTSAADGPKPSTAPICPVCGSPMVLRMARRGRNAGSQFWGCSRYPKCRGTRDA